jgi:streptomycin 6-kinase
MMKLPDAFIKTQREVFGPAGEAFVRDLPDLLASAAARWGLTVLPPFSLSFNYVAPVLLPDGSPAVLKAGVTTNGELHNELAALRAWDGLGAARLLASDPAAGLLLIERAMPGRELADLLLPYSGLHGAGPARDDEATRIAAGVMRRLWRPAPAEYAFPTLQKWTAGLGRLRPTFDGGTGPFPAGLVARAEGLFAELLASQGQPVLLHGDLHHWNILAAEREPWLAIDPKGLVGECEYEVAALLYNPTPILTDWPDLARVLRRRIAVLSEMLGFDPQRLAAWTCAQAVLSAWWTYEDSDPPQLDWPILALAEALS